MNRDLVTIRLEKWGKEIQVQKGAPLISTLAAIGVEFPCGGTGTCGGCRIRVLAGTLPVTSEDQNWLKATEILQGWRLACQARVELPLVLECGQARIEVLADDARIATREKQGLGIAVDLGTTTIAAQLLDLVSGNVLAVRTSLNPQAKFGSDVMSRIRAALSGADLATVARSEIGSIIAELARGRESEILEVVLVGNTVMHHLFCGLDVEPLSHVPFVSPALGEQQFKPRELNWPLDDNCSIRFVRCIGGFVGSDIFAGIVATGIAASDEMAALIDLGTNGEIVVGNRHRLVCASTAAGPAFEAGCVRMGMRAATGAIAYVSESDGNLNVTVLGDVPPVGICGSGIVDAVAVGLRRGAIAVSGRLADPSKAFLISDPVALFQPDIRQLQLAKAAIAAGLRLILSHLRVHPRDLQRLELAGAFGNYIRVHSAVEIGLLEIPEEEIHAAGNTALRGAKMLLSAGKEPEMPVIEHLSLAEMPGFQDEFASCMAFPKAKVMANCDPDPNARKPAKGWLI